MSTSMYVYVCALVEVHTYVPSWGCPELSQFHAGLALEPRQTADFKITARAAADLLHLGTPNAAQTSTYAWAYDLEMQQLCCAGRKTLRAVVTCRKYRAMVTTIRFYISIDVIWLAEQLTTARTLNLSSSKEKFTRVDLRLEFMWSQHSLSHQSNSALI